MADVIYEQPLNGRHILAKETHNDNNTIPMGLYESVAIFQRKQSRLLDNNLDINTGKNHDCPSVAGCLIDSNALFRYYQRDGNKSSLSGRVWIIVN